MFSKLIKKLDAIFSKKDSIRDLVEYVDKESLLFFYGNNYSQAGQDGIINEILRRLNIKNGMFVEFGGWDGVYFSNCRRLYEKGFKGIFIEKNKKKIQQCKFNYPKNDIIIVNEFVGAPKYGVPGRSLINILNDQNIDIEQIKVVSIDTDCPDLDIFCDLGFKPPLIIMEGGTNYTPYLDKDINVPMSFAMKNNQQPFPYIYSQVEKNGYKIVCFQQDSYLVRKDLANNFKDYDHLSLYRDSWFYYSRYMRENIINLRKNNNFIKSLEEKNLGRFSPDPLG